MSPKKEQEPKILNWQSTAIRTSLAEYKKEEWMTTTEFKKQLTEQGINTVVRHNNEGRIYGITFIDHESRSIWNDSALDRKLSANVFNDWWNNGNKPELKMQDSPFLIRT